MIVGIVLAGGRSERMGRPKALLQAGGSTFLERAVHILSAGGCDEVMVVLNEESAAIGELTSRAGARTTPGAGSGSEQIESLRAGLRASPTHVEAAVVLPVDHPAVQPETVAALIRAYEERQAPIVQPVHQGRRGHPVLFSSALFEELLGGTASEGARSVIRAHEAEVEAVETGDQGVLIDVDTPAEYERVFGKLE